MAERASILLLVALLLLEPLALTLVSTSLNTSHQLAVTIDKNTIPNNMGGWVTITLLVPGASPMEETLTVKQIRQGHNTVKFSIDTRTLRQKYLEFVKRAGKHVIYEASLQILYYLVDDKGHTYIASYNLGTQSYYTKIKHLSIAEAHKKAIKNPLALLEAEKITIKEKIKPINMTKVINNLVKAPKNPVVKQSPRGTSSQLPGIKPELYPASAADCPLLTTSIYNQELYNNRYNPPQEWLSQVELVSSSAPKEQIVRDLWELFAELFSKQYYYPGYCSPEEVTSAISSTMLGLGPGVHSVDKLIMKLAEYTGWYSVVAGWQDQYPPGSITKHYDAAPIMHASLTSTSSPLPSGIGLILDIHVTEQHETRVGVALGNILFFGYSNIVDTSQDPKPLFMTPSGVSGCGIGYIYAPADIVYIGDAVAVVYHVEKTYLNGQQVWRATPAFIFVPGYTIQYDFQQIDRIEVECSSTNPIVQEINQAYEDLLGASASLGLTYKLIYDKYVHPNPGSSISEDIDSTRINKDTSFDLGGLVTILFNAIGEGLGGFFTANKFASLSKLALQVVISSATHTSIYAVLTLETEANTNFNEVHVLVTKRTVKDEYLEDIALQYGYPLVLSYYASIDTVS